MVGCRLASRDDARARDGQKVVQVARLLERRKADLPRLQAGVTLRALPAVAALDLVETKPHPRGRPVLQALGYDLEDADEAFEVVEGPS